jgi:hypothetical protein
MSDEVELQFIYAPQPHIISSQIPKQPASKQLVNRYLSTAAQYINRTKSFHVPHTNNNHNRNNIHFQNMPASKLAQSIPTNIHNVNPLTTVKISSNDQPMSINEMNSSSSPLDGNNNSINVNKSQGFVNTLRRSLRKNKERFYNKRSSTMKSCHSLNTYEQTVDEHRNIYKKISMTPTLLCRHQHLSTNNQISSIKNAMEDITNEDQMRKRTRLVEVFFLLCILYCSID